MEDKMEDDVEDETRTVAVATYCVGIPTFLDDETKAIHVLNKVLDNFVFSLEENAAKRVVKYLINKCEDKVYPVSKVNAGTMRPYNYQDHNE